MTQIIIAIEAAAIFLLFTNIAADAIKFKRSKGTIYAWIYGVCAATIFLCEKFT